MAVNIHQSNSQLQKRKYDVYYNESVNRELLAMTRIFGVLRYEINQLHTESEKMNFVESFIRNMLAHAGLFESNKTELLNAIESMYDHHKKLIKEQNERSNNLPTP